MPSADVSGVSEIICNGRSVPANKRKSLKREQKKWIKKLLFKISVGDFDKAASAATFRGQLWILTADYCNNTMRTKAQTILGKGGEKEV